MNKIFWWRFGEMLLLILLQISLVNILFPTSTVPVLILNTIMAIVLVRGFRTGLSEWLFLIVLFDLLRASAVTYFVPYGIFIAYVTSFVSRRFIFEHRGMGSLLLASLAVFSGTLYSLGGIWFEERPFMMGSMLVDGLLLFISFFPMYVLIQWFETRLERISRSEFRGLRKAS